MLVTRVGRRGQITIPKEVRRKLRIEAGDQIEFIVDGEQLVIKPITQTLLGLRGSIRVSSKEDFDAIRKQTISNRVKKRG